MDLYSTPLELLPLEGLRLGEQLLPLAASKEQAEALLGPRRRSSKETSGTTPKASCAWTLTSRAGWNLSNF